MNIEQVSSISGVLQGMAVVLGATLVVYGWVSRTIKKSALRDIGLAFNSTIDGLSSPEIEVRMASAVLLRRFFDKVSELGCTGEICLEKVCSRKIHYGFQFFSHDRSKPRRIQIHLWSKTRFC